MIIKITEVIPAVSQKYPFTHRVEPVCDQNKWEEINDWLENNNIACIAVGRAVYLNPKNTALFSLRWS